MIDSATVFTNNTAGHAGGVLYSSAPSLPVAFQCSSSPNQALESRGMRLSRVTDVLESLPL
jgi:predicted outer membrane repeat protein